MYNSNCNEYVIFTIHKNYFCIMRHLFFEYYQINMKLTAKNYFKTSIYKFELYDYYSKVIIKMYS